MTLKSISKRSALNVLHGQELTLNRLQLIRLLSGSLAGFLSKEFLGSTKGLETLDPHWIQSAALNPLRIQSAALNPVLPDSLSSPCQPHRKTGSPLLCRMTGRGAVSEPRKARQSTDASIRGAAVPMGHGMSSRQRDACMSCRSGSSGSGRRDPHTCSRAYNRTCRRRACTCLRRRAPCAPRRR